jgi:hypothetical protein
MIPYKLHKFSEQEAAQLKQNINNGLYIGIPFCLLFVFGGMFLFYVFLEMGVLKFKYILGMICGAGMSVMGLFFIRLIINGTNLQKKELALGEKAVFQGTITNKRESVAQITDNTDDVLFRRTDNIKRWYVAVDDEDYEVEKPLYDRLEIGNKVEVHLAPDSGYLLDIKVITK